ncbi:GNAT family N-acetyltransferase [uncultured Jatrophihabitans sp.]|uniref:GNAT family N-acetyltransferase n=1 Tax=uncultured Jatrophihabitans sp. TaxID=1610747 RepID=UPI0035CC04B3
MPPRPTVRLVAVDEDVLLRLLATAVGDADPAEVMAPVAGAPGWTPARREAFLGYHRARGASMPRLPIGEVTYAVEVGADVVGALRLIAAPPNPLELEVGLWLGRSYRGHGVGSGALAAAVTRAAELGARSVVARTTAPNTAALAALRRHGFRLAGQDTEQVTARLMLGGTAGPPLRGWTTRGTRP